ncbi:MAG: NAD(+) diphosphatase [Lachnospiraceae bacterium]|nr:NAD(+) diphosphatase [Lachnospiraceae bacterium]
MLQEIETYILENHYDGEKVPGAEDFVVIYKEHQLFVKLRDDGRLSFPRISEWTEPVGKVEKEKFIYLFQIKKEKVERFFLDFSFLHRKDDEEKISENESAEKEKIFDAFFKKGYSFLTARKIGSLIPEPKKYVFAAYTAMHLAEWYLEKRFCGACGKRLHHDTVERAMVCDSCGKKYYPRINPAVIVGVKNGEKLLLTRYREGYRHNALIAGFCEIGETLEETVEREVYEETGLLVKNITYYKSQPWGLAGDMLAGFFCEVDGDTVIHMDEGELKYAEWVEREKIELQPSDYSLTNEMMRRFKEGMEK